MLTGRYPHVHRLGVGIDGLKLPQPRVRERFEQYPALPKLLASRGYRSLQTGKWWEGDYRDAGFTHGMTTGRPVAGSVGLNDDPITGRKGLGPLDRGLSFLAGADGLRIGREGMEPFRRFLREERSRPFFLWYAPMLPHTPHNSPPELFEKYRSLERSEKVARYMAMCEWFDQTCGELLRLLDENDVASNTLVVFVVDNGYIQLPGINWFHKRSKLSPYEAEIRTPILLRWPGNIKPARYEIPVHTIDLARTTLAACGFDPPNDLPGVNLLEFCKGKSLQRDAFFGATFRHKRKKSVRPRTPDDTVDYRWCLAGPWELIVPRAADAKPQLFNVLTDPHEEHNLAAEEPDRVRTLRTRIDRWWSPITEPDS